MVLRKGAERYAKRTIGGFDQVTRFFSRPNTTFWVNSSFTSKQLDVLGGVGLPRYVVFPASRFLDGSNWVVLGDRNQAAVEGLTPLRLLFVSRLVAHKGHRHVIACAMTISEAFGVPVVVDFAGRQDKATIKFNRALRELAALSRDLSRVEVNFHGEVSEPELVELYKNADVFVCLSEHEGFGIPVFEAIRSGVPIVAWASTALKELLAGHPFAFKSFDIAQFSAAIYSLVRSEIRDFVLARQSGLLARYTLAAVREQISQAFEKRVAETEVANDDLQNVAFDEIEGHFGSLLLKCQNAYAALPEQIRQLPHDVPGNYVTLYDLASYMEFFDVMAAARVAALSTSGENARIGEQSVFIRAGEFSVHTGNRDVPEMIEVDLSAAARTHLFFGPYIEIPVGRFAATVHYSLTAAADSEASLVFDVYGRASGVLAQCSRTVLELAPNRRVTLEFSTKYPGDNYEIRSFLDRHTDGNFKLFGVEIRRLSLIEDLVASPNLQLITVAPKQRRRAAPQRPGGLRRLFGGILGAKREDEAANAGRARDRFTAGDKARDAREWQVAAHAYSEGLDLQPDAFEYWIQYGNVLKEAGQVAAAENAYRRAEAIDPTDPEVNLQFGHLYKVSGRPSLAEKRYLQSIHGKRAVLHAYEELRALGVAMPDLLTFADKYPP